MAYDKIFFEKVFSKPRMNKYFSLYPHDEQKAITHYECNIILSEAMYPTLSIMEVLLRNALSRQLSLFMGRTDWYVSVANVPGLADLNKPISQAQKMISGRGETITPSKVTAELTLGFWTTLLNRNYELIL